MIKKIFITALCSISFLIVSAQKNDYVVKIDNKGYTIQEFERLFLKNNDNDHITSLKELKDYADLFINYKLKVLDAIKLGLDTTKSFKDEFNSYRTQLAQPFFIDETVNEDLIKEAYQRMKTDIRASHILIACDKNAIASDTLAAYKKAMDIRKKILKGATFEQIAVEYSDDISARDIEGTPNRAPMKGNKGDLGYFTVFSMVYPFESGAYNTPKGAISMPIRSDFGYHIINVTDIKPAMNKVQLAHIFVKIPQNVTTQDSLNIKQKVDSAYLALMSGTTFEEAAKKYSDDQYTSQSGGLLPWMSCTRMFPEFAEQVYKLKKNDISTPIKTPYGWHIIKLIDRQEIGNYEDLYESVKQNVLKDSRANKSKEAIITKIKKDFGFNKIDGTLDDFYSRTDSLEMNKWKTIQAAGLNKEMFSLKDNSWSQADFALFIEENQNHYSGETSVNKLNILYSAFEEASLLKYYDSKLELLFPDFKYLVDEYHDGILLFDITDKNVWNKAVVDTLGLENFYNLNKNKYMWNDRIDISIYNVSDQSILNKLRKLASKGKSDEEIKLAVLGKKNKDASKAGYSVVSGIYSKGDDLYVDSLEWKPGLTEVKDSAGLRKFAFIKRVIGPEPKKLNEAKGIITADYQNYLEREWIKQLRSNHNITIDDTLLDTLIKK